MDPRDVLAKVRIDDKTPDVLVLPSTLTKDARIERVLDPRVQAVAEEYYTSPDRLVGKNMPGHVYLAEKPIHRMMVYLQAAGYTVREIAEQTGYSAASVNLVLQQPAAREASRQIIAENGGEAVTRFLNKQVGPSLLVLQEIRDDITAARRDRAAAANSLLDRALGKPLTKVESDNTNRNVPADMARIDAELETLRKKNEGTAND